MKLSKNKTAGRITLALDKRNYQLLGAGLLMVVVGFILMSGGGSNNPAIFSEAVFGFQQLTVAPLVVLSGYVICGLGIVLQRKQQG